jgi:hypothetical protein
MEQAWGGIYSTDGASLLTTSCFFVHFGQVVFICRLLVIKGWNRAMQNQFLNVLYRVLAYWVQFTFLVETGFVLFGKENIS